MSRARLPIARELALKALFQIDVGKQTVDDALRGALETLHIPLRNAVDQAASAGEAKVEELVKRHSGENLDKENRKLARKAIKVLSELASSLKEIASDAILTDSGDRSYELGVRIALERARASLKKLGNESFLTSGFALNLSAQATESSGAIVAAFDKHIGTAVELAGYAADLTHGVARHREEIDGKISAHVSDWPLDRLASADRNILRLGVFEIEFVTSVASAQVINSAVELAKKFSTAESASFVNGVLHQIASELDQGAIEPELVEA